MSKSRVFSGTRATGRLHLGNYLGAVKGYIALQNDPKYECLYMAMDLHAITTPFIPKKLAQATQDIIMDYLAAGLNPQKAIITAQSLIPEHLYLTWLFSSVVSVARMQHLPTFKDKVKQHPDNVTMALLNYPVLMAADILIYRASLVPVGVDQEPHLEIAREIARKMNDQYGTDLPEPQRFSTQAEYVPALKGKGKMSKSVEGSYINLMDSLKTIQSKLAAVPTDEGKGKILDPSQLNDQLVQKTDQPAEQRVAGKIGKKYFNQAGHESTGVASLLTFVELFQGKDQRQQYEDQYQSTGIRYGELKKDLAEAIHQDLKPIQKKRRDLEKNLDYVEQVIKKGTDQAREIAAKNLTEVKKKMGLL